VVRFTPQPLYFHGKSPWYPLGRRRGGPQSRSGRGGEEKIPSPYRHSTPRSYSPQPSAVPPSYKGLKIKIYKTVLPVVLYGCRIWSLTLNKEYVLRAFEKKVLRIIFVPKREEITG
jgi:hypothetical protein